MDEINEVFYTITTWDGSQMETSDREEAKIALREGGAVIKNSRKIFRSGLSDIRLYVNTEIHKIKDI